MNNRDQTTNTGGTNGPAETTGPATPDEGEGVGGAAERGVLDLITAIKDGTTEPRTIRAEDRQRCVAYLLGEGITVAHIAQMLKRSEKTIERDRKQLQEDSALQHDPMLAARMAGTLKVEAETIVGRLRRVAREKDCPHAVRVEAEKVAFQIFCDLVIRLQSLGFLPTAAHRLDAHVTHQAGDIPELDHIETEVSRLSAIAAAALPPGSPQAGALTELFDLTQRAKLASRIHDFAATIDAPPPTAPEVPHDGTT